METMSCTKEKTEIKEEILPSQEVGDDVSGGYGDEVQNPVMQETVWLKQQSVEEAEAAFQKLSIKNEAEATAQSENGGEASDDEDDDESTSSADQEPSPYMFETIWFQQPLFENAETLYQEVLAGTADLSTISVPHGTPVKRHHAQEKTNNKKMKSDKDIDVKHTKLHNQIKSLTRSAETINRHLNDFEKTQRRKAQAIQDTVLRLNSSIEACQNRLNEELSQSTNQIAWFRSLLQDMNSVIQKTETLLQAKDSGQTRALSTFYHTMSERIARMDTNLNQCIETCNGLQADVPKTEINRIVGEIGKLSLFKKRSSSDRFVQKQEEVAKMLKDLMTEKYTPGSTSSSVVSDQSMEANVSSGQSSDEKEEKKGKSNGTVKRKPGKRMKNRLPGGIKPVPEGIKSGSNAQTPTKPIPQQGGAKPKMSAAGNKQNATPKKRNAQGSQSNTAYQKQEQVFRFKGASVHRGITPYLHQPGILGPRPNSFPLSERAQSFTPRFQGFTGLRDDMNHPNNANFNFSQYPTQQQAPPMAMGANMQNTGMAPLGLNLPGPNAGGDKSPGNRLNHSKLFQILRQQQQQQQQTQHQELQPGFGMGYPQGQLSPNMLPSGGSPGRQLQGSVEQQLNEMAQKIQQMQVCTTQVYQLQHLMQETQRLKHLVAQKQHENQQQDAFQQQFQVLINAFIQQQQMQAQQQPQPKMAKAMPSPQQHRLFLNKQYQLHQQQKKQKQQHNKHQYAKQEGFSPSESDTPPPNASKQQGKPLISERKTKTEISPKSSQPGAKSNGVSGKVPHKNSKLVRKGLFNPFAQGDKHQAGVSSVVVLEALNCVVLVDIMNNCLKLYDISSDGSSSNSLNHRLVSRLDVPLPFYMARLSLDSVVVSRQTNLLTVVRVSKRRLELVRNIECSCQYYGLAYISPGQLACAAFKDNRIDLVSLKDDNINTTILTSNCVAPELVSCLSGSDLIVYLEKEKDVAVKLYALNSAGQQMFVVNLDVQCDAVWNFVCCGDKIICSNKSSHKLKMFSSTGSLLTELNCPGGTMKQPFAMAYSDQGFLYVSNDGAWDSKYQHFVTTEINVFAFS